MSEYSDFGEMPDSIGEPGLEDDDLGNSLSGLGDELSDLGDVFTAIGALAPDSSGVEGPSNMEALLEGVLNDAVADEQTMASSTDQFPQDAFLEQPVDVIDNPYTADTESGQTADVTDNPYMAVVDSMEVVPSGIQRAISVAEEMSEAEGTSDAEETPEAEEMEATSASDNPFEGFSPDEIKSAAGEMHDANMTVNRNIQA